MGFLDYTGSIKIDGVEVSTIPKDRLRSAITTVSQDMLELDGTIRDNIIPHEGDTPKEDRTPDITITEVLELVGIANYVVQQGGLDKEMSELRPSFGQKQRLALARAILHHRRNRSKIVLLDEATSSMDFIDDKEMQALLTRTFAHCTVLTVTHRVESLKKAQVLLELDQGRGTFHTDMMRYAHLLGIPLTG